MNKNLLSTREKFWYLVGPVTVSLVFATTRPIIQIYFVSHIEPQILAMANLLETGLAAIVNYTIQYETLKELYRKYFFYIVITDILIFSATSLIGVDYPAVRFFGFSILNAVSTCLWFMIMKNVVNRIIIDGDERTNFDALNQTTCLAASFIGKFYRRDFRSNFRQYFCRNLCNGSMCSKCFYGSDGFVFVQNFKKSL